MPKIMRSGGRLNVTDDVVKIRDLGPNRGLKPPGGAGPKRPDTGADFSADDLLLDGSPMGDEAYEEEEFGDSARINSSQSAIKEEIVQSAMAEAGRILEDALRQAEETKQAKLAEVQYEADEMRHRAMEDGRMEGMGQVVQQAQQAADGLENAIATFEGERAGFEAEYEGQLKWLAIEIASKVLAKKVDENDAEMLEMVQKAVQTVKSEPWIRIEVASEMVRLIDALNSAFTGQENVEVSAIPADAGTVHIETPSGLVDASLRTQLENLREYFSTAQ